MTIKYINIYFLIGKIYIGITCKDVNTRWANGLGYRHNIYITNAIKKYGWNNVKHEIIRTNLNKEKAELLEKYYIYKYKSNNKKYGYNIQNGGNSNGKHSEETKEKIRLAHIGMHYNDEFKKKQSESKIGNKNMLGKHHSEETKSKISNANKGKLSGDKNYFSNHKYVGKNNVKSKEIIRLDMKGNFIDKKESANLYAKELNIKNSGHIIDVCKGRRKSAYGYIWDYAEGVI